MKRTRSSQAVKTAAQRVNSRLNIKRQRVAGGQSVLSMPHVLQYVPLLISPFWRHSKETDNLLSKFTLIDGFFCLLYAR
jgi:hypothetical protein